MAGRASRSKARTAAFASAGAERSARALPRFPGKPPLQQPGTAPGPAAPAESSASGRSPLRSAAMAVLGLPPVFPRCAFHAVPSLWLDASVSFQAPHHHGAAPAAGHREAALSVPSMRLEEMARGLRPPARAGRASRGPADGTTSSAAVAKRPRSDRSPIAGRVGRESRAARHRGLGLHPGSIRVPSISLNTAS